MEHKDTLLKRFGSVVRMRRLALALSQEGLAARAKIDTSYVGGIERGKRNPTLVVIFQLAKALKVEAPFLIEQMHSLDDKLLGIE